MFKIQKKLSEIITIFCEGCILVLGNTRIQPSQKIEGCILVLGNSFVDEIVYDFECIFQKQNWNIRRLQTFILNLSLNFLKQFFSSKMFKLLVMTLSLSY